MIKRNPNLFLSIVTIVLIGIFIVALPYKNLTIHKGKPVVIEGKDTLRVFTTVR